MTKFKTAKEVREWVKSVNTTALCVYEVTNGYRADYMSLAEVCGVSVEYAGKGQVMLNGEEVDPLYAENKLDRLYEELGENQIRDLFGSKERAITWAKEHFNAEDEEQLEQMRELIAEIRSARK